MKLFELTSGFIAAVLIALGAYQYVNNATVEEEPGVKGEAQFTTDPGFWVLNSDGDYIYHQQLPPNGQCRATLPFPCYVEKTESSDIPLEFSADELDNYPFEDEDMSPSNGPYQ